MLNFLFLSLISEMVEMVEVLSTKFNISYANPHRKRSQKREINQKCITVPHCICDTVIINEI